MKHTTKCTDTKLGVWLLAIATAALIAFVAESAHATDFSKLKVNIGAGITKKQLPTIITSEEIYCLRVANQNYLASKGAITMFKKTLTSRTKKARCNSNVKIGAVKAKKQVIQLSKSKMTDAAYKELSEGLVNVHE